MDYLSSLSQLFRSRVSDHPGLPAFRFLVDGEVGGRVTTLTFAELRDRAAGVAAELARQTAPGDRVLLLFEPGLDFVVAFWACQLAGRVPVPAPPPENDRSPTWAPRVAGIARDAAPRAVLSTEPTCSSLRARADALGALSWLLVYQIQPSLDDVTESPADLAFIQYTSGSTTSPRGVMITQRNALANARMISRAMGIGAADRAVRPGDGFTCDTSVSWLPTFHDMGLVGFVIQPIYFRMTSILMAPMAFLRKPARWLEAIDHYRAVIAGAPSSGYARCADAADVERRRLDLSCWRVAFCGAEPVRAAVLDRFAARFRSCGFDPAALFPCYGMAESTLMISGGPPGSGARHRPFRGLDVGRAEPGLPGDPEIVACGQVADGAEVRIVAPGEDRPLPDGHIGEILVAGPHVSPGYLSGDGEGTFGARLPGEPFDFLRTGDLGFKLDDQLHVTGRIKDLIILQGKNHYPQDIERTAEQLHPAIRASRQAAFSVTEGEHERLVVLCELGRAAPEGEVAAAIRAGLAEAHGVDARVVIGARGSIPHTSSGKVQRSLARQKWQRGELSVLFETHPSPAPLSPPPPVAAPRNDEARPSGAPARSDDDGALGPDQIRSYITQWIQERVRPGPVVAAAPLSAAGLDSLHLVQLAADLEGWLGFEVPPELLFGTPLRRLGAVLAHGQRAAGVGRPRDLAGDAALPDDLVRGPPRGGAEVLLTGATGFLGIYLLDRLLRSGRRVICLVRAIDDARALERVRRAAEVFGFPLGEGVTAIAGDLGRPDMGLDPAVAEALAGRIGAVVHSGAEIHWGKSYSSLKAVNVGGTLSVLRLAARAGAEIHHISSVGVFPFAEDTRPEFPEDAPAAEGELLRLGYFQSKWVAERLLENAKGRGFDVTIYRPGFISGDSRTGAEIATENQLFHAFLAGCLQMGEAPAVDKVLDLVPVDWVADSIVALMADPRAKNRRLNLVNDRQLPQRQLYQWLRDQGHELREVAYPRWREAVLSGRGDNPLGRFAIYYRLMTEARMARVEVQMAERMPVDARLSRALLADAGVRCPPFDSRLLETYVSYYRRAGLLPAPRAAAPRPAAPTREEARLPGAVLVDATRNADERLLQLYCRGKEKQWNGERRIDWSIPMDPENPQDLPDVMLPLFGSPLFERMTARERGEARRHFQAWQLSQFMHGEQGALLCAARIVQQAPTIEGRLYAATQVMDESRHLEVFARLLRDKFELHYPITAPLERLLQQVLAHSSWDMTCLGMQVLIEGLALAAFGVIRDQSKNRLAVQVNAYVMEDEARHVAFGRSLLAPLYAEQSAAERAEREEFVIEASYLLRDRFLALDVWEALGLPAGACAAWLRESGFQRAWQKELFSRIVPTIRAIGLWGPGVRKAYSQMGVLGFADQDLDALGAKDEAAARLLDGEA